MSVTGDPRGRGCNAPGGNDGVRIAGGVIHAQQHLARADNALCEIRHPVAPHGGDPKSFPTLVVVSFSSTDSTCTLGGSQRYRECQVLSLQALHPYELPRVPVGHIFFSLAPRLVVAEFALCCVGFTVGSRCWRLGGQWVWTHTATAPLLPTIPPSIYYPPFPPLSS